VDEWDCFSVLFSYSGVEHAGSATTVLADQLQYLADTSIIPRTLDGQNTAQFK